MSFVSEEKPTLTRTITSKRLIHIETEIAKKTAISKEWIESILKDSLQSEFFSSIENGRSCCVIVTMWLGIVLCRLINVIRPDSIKKINTEDKQWKKIENIAEFLRICTLLGMKQEQLFDATDLLENRNQLNILNCILHLKQIALTIVNSGEQPPLSTENSPTDDSREPKSNSRESTSPSVDPAPIITSQNSTEEVIESFPDPPAKEEEEEGEKPKEVLQPEIPIQEKEAVPEEPQQQTNSPEVSSVPEPIQETSQVDLSTERNKEDTQPESTETTTNEQQSTEDAQIEHKPSRPTKRPPPIPVEPQQTEEEVKPVKPTKKPPPVPSNSQPIESNYDSLIESTHTNLEKGKFKDALKNVSSAISVLISKDPINSQAQVKYCVMYKLALKLLINVKKGEADAGSLCLRHKFLADLPLEPKHRAVCMRMAISKNMEYENYGLAARYLELLLNVKKLSDRAKLEEKLEVCKSNDKVDYKLPLYVCPKCKEETSAGNVECSCGRKIRICFSTFELLRKLEYYACNWCGALFSEMNDSCSYCKYGTLTIVQ